MIRPLTFLWLALCLVAAAPARAQTCIVQANGDCMLEPSAAQGEDVSPYCFLPTLARGQYETSYAFSATDDEGVCHNFETFLRFQLPAGLLEPGETVTTARLLLSYAFTFRFDEPAPTLPHEPITVDVSEVSSSWTEAAVTWANRPGFVSPPVASLSNVTHLGVKEFIVTDLVRVWAHGTKPNRGFAVTSPNDIPFGMNSWEADPAVPSFQKARLRITVGPGAAPTPVTVFPY